MTRTLFTSARWKLTLWYVLAIVMLCMIFSSLFYIQTSQTLEREYNQLEIRVQEREMMLFPDGSTLPYDKMVFRRIQPEDLAFARKQILLQLIVSNAFIITGFAILAYFFAGKTLEPIKRVHDQQQRFIGDAAHELKTPITALRSSLEVNLMDKKITGSSRTILKENLEEVIDLENLSERLLQLAKTQGDSSKKALFSLQDSLTKALKTLQPLAKKKALTIESHWTKKPLQIFADQSRITELWMILLENAIKFSCEKQNISIQVSQTRHQAIVKIKDSGIGIAQEEIPFIFDRFYRSDTSRNKNTTGYGLGLALAKQILDEEKGLISVDSRLGTGSTFRVSLPLANQKENNSAT